MTVLAQAYIHLLVHPTDQEISDAYEYLEYVAAVSAVQRFKLDIELDLRLEEGSLKGWLTVVGGVYAAICGYGSFREGVDYLVDDSKAFSEYVIQRMQSESHIPKGKVYRTERRLGVPGKIKRLYPLIDETSELIKKGQASQAQENLEFLKRRISTIEMELDSPDDVRVINAFGESLPEPFRQSVIEVPAPSPPPSRPLVLGSSLELGRRTRRKPQEILSTTVKPPKPPSFDR